jgi:hypothetical protein
VTHGLTFALQGSLALISNGTESRYQPQYEEINYLLVTPFENVSIPLLEPDRLWSNAMFNRDLKVVIMVSGWTTDINFTIDSAAGIYEAYKARGDSNFILLDSARYIDTLYTWSAFNNQYSAAGRLYGRGAGRFGRFGSS